MPTAGSGDVPMEMAGSGEEMPPPHMDLGKGDGSDVITIGDSWMTLYSGGIEGALDRAGTKYRHYGIAGTTLIGGDIPQQYVRAKAANPDIKTVIMTGGGNDIMFTGGCNTKEACEMSVAAINDALNKLWTDMAKDGVKDVIYVQYSKDAGTTPQDTRPTTPPPPPPICLTGMIGCHSLPTTDLVMGQLVDGIHPSGAAHDRIAAALLDMMEMSGMRR
jgi:lysophospholipase L1-like esterase